MKLANRAMPDRRVVAIILLCSASLMGGARAQTSQTGRIPSDAILLRQYVMVKRVRAFGCEQLSFETNSKIDAPDVSDCIRGADQSEWPVRVRITEMHSSKVFDINVTEVGGFSLNGVTPGVYVLRATQKGQTVALGTITLPLKINPIVEQQ